jgi:hypothetical protein
LVKDGAGVVVVAAERIVGVLALKDRVAAVIGTQISIVTVRNFTSQASTTCTKVLRGAGVAVIARLCVVDVHTTHDRITAIVGTSLLIVTIGWCVSHTRCVKALVYCGTGVAVVTGQCIRCKEAAIHRVTAIVRA